MTKIYENYKCDICGNIVQMLHGGQGQLVCCNKEMKLLSENTVDAATEKHVPVIEEIDNGIKVKVGSVAHPMEDSHYIEWIEVINGSYIQRKHLKPGDKPEADFYVKYSDKLVAREYCNMHGHWKS
jgi:superoxide reductase